MKKNIIKTFAFMFSAMFLAKILGLARNIIFAKFYGTGIEATAFFTASRIPLQLLDITLGAAISSTFIPVFNEYLKKSGKNRAIEFANNFLNVVIIITMVLTILGTIFAPSIVNIIAPNLGAETYTIPVKLSRLLFPIMIFTAVAFVFVGFLQSMDEFNIPAIISVVSNGILILYLLTFNNKFGIVGVAIAMAIGWLTQVIVQLPSVKKKGFKYSLKTNFKDEGLKKVVKLAIPTLVSSWVQPINNIVNLRLASGLEDGAAVSAIEYAYNIYLIVVGVFSYTLSNIVFPELSKLSAENETDKLKIIIKNALEVTALFVIPMSIGIAFLSSDIIKIIYERGEFTTQSTYLTSGALSFYAIGMIGYGIMEILNKVFYAMQDAKTPMKTSGIAIILNIVLSIVLVKVMGYRGLPLAASIVSIIVAAIMILIAFSKIKLNFEKENILEIVKYIIAGVVLVSVLAIVNIFKFGSILKIVISVLLGMVSYFTVLFLLKSEMIDYAIKQIKEKIKS